MTPIFQLLSHKETFGKRCTTFGPWLAPIILGGSYFLINFHQIGMGLFGFALFLAIFSGIDYFKKSLKSIIV